MSSHPSPDTVSSFLDRIGRGLFEYATGYSAPAVSRTVSQNVMPARWYLRVRELCNDLGVETPEHLFRMDRACLNKQFANDTTEKQVGKSRKNSTRGCNS